MPIRFRCPHCDQLMGIARRKTGLTVQCPRCREAVVVPAPDLRQASHARRTVEVNQPRFERRDFDEIFAAALANAPAQNPKTVTRNPKAALVQAPAALPARPAPAKAVLLEAPIGQAMAETTVDTAGLPPASLAAQPVAVRVLLAATPRLPGVSRLLAGGIAVFSFFAGILLGLALR
jgi:phage FluMu protein Com